MNYKEKYLDSLKELNRYKSLFLIVIIFCGFFVISNMNLFYGYYFTIFYFIFAIWQFTKSLISIRKEVSNIKGDSS